MVVVQLSLTVGDEPLGDMVFRLSSVPAAERFLALVTGEPPAPSLLGSKIHRLIPGYVAQGGDVENGDGTGGAGDAYPDDALALATPHSLGCLSCANRGPNTNGSQFLICLAPPGSDATAALDRKHGVFATMVSGFATLAALQAVPCGADDVPVRPIVVALCGPTTELYPPLTAGVFPRVPADVEPPQRREIAQQAFDHYRAQAAAVAATDVGDLTPALADFDAAVLWGRVGGVDLRATLVEMAAAQVRMGMYRCALETLADAEAAGAPSPLLHLVRAKAAVMGHKLEEARAAALALERVGAEATVVAGIRADIVAREPKRDAYYSY